MAIVFISPRQRQNMFFAGITAVFGLILLVFSVLVLFAKPNAVPQELVFNRPKIDIDLKVLDSEMVKNFEPALKMDMQFQYTAVNSKGVKISGFLTAPSINEAQKILLGMEMTNIVLEETGAGRENPFAPY